jgi:hypothetical protein
MTILVVCNQLKPTFYGRKNYRLGKLSYPHWLDHCLCFIRQSKSKKFTRYISSPTKFWTHGNKPGHLYCILDARIYGSLPILPPYDNLDSTCCALGFGFDLGAKRRRKAIACCRNLLSTMVSVY